MARAVGDLGSDEHLGAYQAAIQRKPMLEPDEELALARAWRDHGDRRAHGRLVESHLRLVAAIARRYRGYGLSMADIVAEGNLGLLHAAQAFDPERGVRFSTYATYWIRAMIQEHILRSWSLVRMGTTSSQKRLFFGVRRLRAQLGAMDGRDLPPETVERAARELRASAEDVVRMDRRVCGMDRSLNVVPPGAETGEAIELLVDDAPNQEALLARHQEGLQRRALLAEGLKRLKDRERDILTRRRLVETPVRLEDLSRVYGISRERVRQIEMDAVEKLRRLVADALRRGMAPA
ncbi:RNA polymerase factor sigma-32 [Arenibaculum sp.]|jgi:RNA polymerase sigma-32 factor|uniref:RNA polymerase factor sigma-32 n=1 Tax=Arenibaculum sp. TaxID=2865862 RepID=UPI002E0FCCA9|nr:RNA polymerase factor sigma-32 [Arenibaculum sp.]